MSREFLDDQSFDPETLCDMSVAFDRVCAELGLADVLREFSQHGGWAPSKKMGLSRAGP